MLAAAAEPIEMWRPETDFVEQSSEDIWRACGLVVRAALRDAAARPEQVRGIGFGTADRVAMALGIGRDDEPGGRCRVIRPSATSR